MRSIFLNPLAAVMAVCLVACGGGSGGTGGTQTSTPAPITPPVGASKNLLFVSDVGHRVLSVVDTLNPAANTSIVGNVLSMEPTADGGVAYDAQKDLLYATAGRLEFAGNSIIVFERASALRGSVKPNRTISPIVSNVGHIGALILDKERDILYADVGGSSIAVFRNASKLNGGSTPDLVIPAKSTSFAVDFKRSILYVTIASPFDTYIYAYSGLDTMTPADNPRRTIRIDSIRTLDGMAIDSGRDRLYLVGNQGAVAVVDNASSAGNSFGSAPDVAATVTPTMIVPIAPRPDYVLVNVVAIDSANDRLYIGSGNKAVIVNAASKLTAATVPNDVVAISAPSASNIRSFAFP